MSGLVIGYAAPTVEVPGTNGSPSIQPYSLATGQTCNDGDIVALAATGIEPIAANYALATIVGVAQHNSASVFDQQDTGPQGVFGADNVGTGLLPAAPGQTLVALVAAPAIVEMSLPATTGWISGFTNQANIGTAVGIGLDATTGYYYADDQASNKTGIIVAKRNGPTTQINNGQTLQPVGPGGVGDAGARVYVSFDAAVLAAVGGL